MSSLRHASSCMARRNSCRVVSFENSPSRSILVAISTIFLTMPPKIFRNDIRDMSDTAPQEECRAHLLGPIHRPYDPKSGAIPLRLHAGIRGRVVLGTAGEAPETEDESQLSPASGGRIGDQGLGYRELVCPVMNRDG